MASRHSKGVASDWSLADEGAYFVGVNALASPLTGQATPVVGDDATEPFINIFNNGKTYIYPDFVFIETVAPGTNGTINYVVANLDNKGTTARTGGGTQITMNSTHSKAGTVIPPWTSIPANGNAQVFAGAVATTMTSPKIVLQQVVREVVPVAGDTLTIVFGDPAPSTHTATPTSGTATAHLVVYGPPVCIAPGGNLAIALIRAAQTVAGTYNVQIGVFEKGGPQVIS